MHPPDARAQLAAGLRVVRRGPHHLQVGLYDGYRAVLPRSESVQRALGLLLERRAVGDDPAVRAVLATLDRHGLLSWEPRSTQPRPRVALLGPWEAPDAEALLEAAGLCPAPAGGEVEMVVVLSMGELDRVLLDPLVRAGTTHLVVRLVDGGAILGPFVVPGSTACLRCIDAHHAEHDPAHVEVTTRYVRATGHPRGDGASDVETRAATIALAWALRDVAAHGSPDGSPRPGRGRSCSPTPRLVTTTTAGSDTLDVDVRGSPDHRLSGTM